MVAARRGAAHAVMRQQNLLVLRDTALRVLSLRTNHGSALQRSPWPHVACAT